MSGDFRDERLDFALFALLEELVLIPCCFLVRVEAFFGEDLEDRSWFGPGLGVLSSDLGFPGLVGMAFDFEKNGNIGDDGRCLQWLRVLRNVDRGAKLCRLGRRRENQTLRSECTTSGNQGGVIQVH